MKPLFMMMLYLLSLTATLAGEEAIGFWKTVDEKTGKARSIIAIYEYQGKYYGRIIATYDDSEKIDATIDHPKGLAPGVKGNPPYAGLDILWGLKPEGDKYTGGQILDPEKGDIYDAEMWTKDGNLIVRGQLLIFGRNQTWPPAKDSDFPPDFKKPDLKQLTPVIPKVKY